MTLEELYTSLSLGVLSNLSVSGEGSGMIPYQHQAKVGNAVNQALTALHGRFVLSTQEVQLRAYDQISLYQLRKRYADQDPTTVTQKYITDSVEYPFQDDVLRVLEVYDEEGTKLLLNDPSPSCKVFTPNPTTVQLVEPVTGNTYFILYQARHPKLVPDGLEQEITLPDILLPALEAYVAHLILSPMNGQEHAAKSAEHFAKYEMVCGEVEDRDLVSTSQTQETDKLDARGFC